MHRRTGWSLVGAFPANAVSVLIFEHALSGSPGSRSLPWLSVWSSAQGFLVVGPATSLPTERALTSLREDAFTERLSVLQDDVIVEVGPNRTRHVAATPLHFVLKTASRGNLNCSYCCVSKHERSDAIAL